MVATAKSKANLTAGNPNRTQSMTTNQFGMLLKEKTPEAVDNIVAYMRDAKAETDGYISKIEVLQKDLVGAVEVDAILEITSEIKQLLSLKEKSDERVLKASIKIVDVTYNLAVHTDNNNLKKTANRLKNKGFADDEAEEKKKASGSKVSAISLTIAK